MAWAIHNADGGSVHPIRHRSPAEATDRRPWDESKSEIWIVPSLDSQTELAHSVEPCVFYSSSKYGPLPGAPY